MQSIRLNSTYLLALSLGENMLQTTDQSEALTEEIEAEDDDA